MPTYEYRCSTCEERFEVVQSFSDDPLTACPAADDPARPAGCVLPGQGEVRKVFSAPAITFKGSGFYKTDNRSSSKSGSSGSSGSGDSSSSSSDSSKTSSDSKTSTSSDSSKTSSDSKSSSGSASSTSSTSSKTG